MKAEIIKKKLGVLFKDCTYENFINGYDPAGDLICIAEANSDTEILSKDDICCIFEANELELRDNLNSQIYQIREKTAPFIYKKYFRPFFNSTIKSVYDSNSTDELKKCKPAFDKWVFILLATMTEYYFREEYPLYDDDFKCFKLILNRCNFDSYYINDRYNSLPPF